MIAGATVALLAPSAGGTLSGGFLVNRALARIPEIDQIDATSAAELERALDRAADATPLVDSLYLFDEATARVLACAAAARPVILLAHSLPSLIPGPAPAARRAMIARERAFLSRAHGAVAPSRFMAGALERRGLARTAVAEPAPVCDGRSATRGSRHAFAAGAPVRILTVANRTRAKGIVDAAEAVRRFDRGGDRWHWTIVGSREADPESAAEFDSFVRRHGLADRIAELPPQAPQTLSRYYEQADVFLLPSYMESYGLVFAEAITFGVPAVGYRCGGVPEVVADAGVLVTPGDTDALASGIAAAARRPESGTPGRLSRATATCAPRPARADLHARLRRRAATLPDGEASIAAFREAIRTVLATRRPR